VHDPDALGEALVSLLDAAEVRWRPEDVVVHHGFTSSRMTLVDPAGGSYELLRKEPAFTPAEYARAQALVEVSGAVLRRQDEHTTLLLPDGAELLIRPAVGDDAEAVRRLHARSSATSRQHRYPGGGQTPGDARLRRLLEPVGGVTLLALHHEPGTGEDRVVAMANLLAEGDLGEVAMLVDDAWQRRGIGTALLRRLVAYARHGGFAALVAHAGADNVAMLRTLRRIGAGTAHRDGTMVSVTLPMAPGRHPAPNETPANAGLPHGLPSRHPANRPGPT
jgi:GNAT superfamily N-acetyltransferase